MDGSAFVSILAPAAAGLVKDGNQLIVVEIGGADKGQKHRILEIR
jgi:hypothetical protein